MIDEYDGAGARAKIYVVDGGEPIAWFDSSGPYGAYHADERGSVVALSDSSPQVRLIAAPFRHRKHR